MNMIGHQAVSQIADACLYKLFMQQVKIFFPICYREENILGPHTSLDDTIRISRDNYSFRFGHDSENSL